MKSINKHTLVFGSFLLYAAFVLSIVPLSFARAQDATPEQQAQTDQAAQAQDQAAQQDQQAAQDQAAQAQAQSDQQPPETQAPEVVAGEDVTPLVTDSNGGDLQETPIAPADDQNAVNNLDATVDGSIDVSNTDLSTNIGDLTPTQENAEDTLLQNPDANVSVAADASVDTTPSDQTPVDQSVAPDGSSGGSTDSGSAPVQTDQSAGGSGQ